MTLIHIDGLPGAGKSTVVDGLQARGFGAVDVDDGITVWRHKETGAVRSPEDFPGGRGAEHYDWAVSRAALVELVARTEGVTVFVAGSISNLYEVSDLFAARFAMVVPVATLIARLDARPWDSWGHEPEQQAWIADWHDHFLERSHRDGAIVVDVGALTETEVVDAVLASCTARPVDADWFRRVRSEAVAAAEAEFVTGDLEPPTSER